jgi:tRNA dimethylallyltransferase
MDQGLVEEVQGLLARGLTDADISMKGIGYKEIIGHLQGEYDIEEARRLIKRNTRHLAKRQITWFKRYEDMKWMDISSFPDEEIAIEEMIRWLRGNLKK